MAEPSRPTKQNPRTELSSENQDALDDLLVAIETSGRRLGIYIAVCDDPQLKEEIISRYEQELAPEFQHYRLTLDTEEPSIKALLNRQVKEDARLQQGQKAVMTILGAERLRWLKSDDKRSQQEIFFGYLQWTREGLQDFPFAIVLWVTYQLQEQLSRRAPDFWSWRRDVVRFVSPKRQAISTDELSSLRGHEQFSRFEEVGNTLPIDDLEALIAETATKSPGSALLASLYLQTGRAYVSRVEAGRAQDYKGEIEKATTHLKMAAELLKSSDALEEYADSLDRLARTYEIQGRYGEAEPLYVQALEIRQAELGDRHPDTATSLNNLAGLYRSQGRYGEAEPLFVQALEICKAELGDRHPDTATSLNNLAGLYDSQGRYGEAEPLFVQALEISKAELGDRHPDTATSLFNLAALYHNTQRQQQALAYIQQALDIYIPTLSRDHPTTQAAMSWREAIQRAVDASS